MDNCKLKQGGCPLATCGVWKQDFQRSESLCPFMSGLFPWPLSTVACTVADYTPVTLRIVCKSDNEIEIVDKTTFGRNVTEVSFVVRLSCHLFLCPHFPSSLLPIPPQSVAPWEARALTTHRARVVWRDRSKVPIFALDKIIHQNLSLVSARICNCLKPRQLHLPLHFCCSFYLRLLFSFFLCHLFSPFLFPHSSFSTKKIIQDNFGREWDLHFNSWR